MIRQGTYFKCQDCASIQSGDIIKNIQCSHFFCFQCQQSRTEKQTNSYCPNQNCEQKLPNYELYNKINREQRGFNIIEDNRDPPIQKKCLQTRKICSFCQNSIESTYIYKPKSCNHNYCMNCIEIKFKNEVGTFYTCKFPYCNVFIPNGEITEFWNNAQKILEKENQIAALKESINCGVCKINLQSKPHFTNSYCQHKICPSCLERRRSTLTKCLQSDCYASINIPEVREFFKQMENQNGKNSQNTKLDYGQLQINRNNACNQCDEKILDSSKLFKNKNCPHILCKSCFDSASGNGRSRFFKCPLIVCMQDFQREINELPEKEGKNICTFCKKEIGDPEFYKNQSCQHKICFPCVPLMEKSYYCQHQGCYQKINLDDALMQYDDFQFQKVLQESSSKIEFLQIQCSSCNHLNKVESQGKQESIDYVKCEKCSATTCLLHKEQMRLCFCLCPHCLKQTQITKQFKFCTKCRVYLCKICGENKINKDLLDITNHNCQTTLEPELTNQILTLDKCPICFEPQYKGTLVCDCINSFCSFCCIKIRSGKVKCQCNHYICRTCTNRKNTCKFCQLKM